MHLGIPPLIDGDTLYSNDIANANLLKKHFQTKSELKINGTLENIIFSEIKVEQDQENM